MRSSEHEIGTTGKSDCLAVVVYELEHFPGLNAVLLEILDVGVELGFVVVAITESRIFGAAATTMVFPFLMSAVCA